MDEREDNGVPDALTDPTTKSVLPHHNRCDDQMIVIANVQTVLESLPPFAVPPVSTARIVTLAVPTAISFGLYVSVPSGVTAGCTVKSPGLSLPTTNVTAWPDSSAGPGLMLVAQPAIDCAPRRETTVWFEPGAKLGASLTGAIAIVSVRGALVSFPLSQCHRRHGR